MVPSKQPKIVWDHFFQTLDFQQSVMLKGCQSPELKEQHRGGPLLESQEKPLSTSHAQTHRQSCADVPYHPPNCHAAMPGDRRAVGLC